MTPPKFIKFSELSGVDVRRGNPNIWIGQYIGKFNNKRTYKCIFTTIKTQPYIKGSHVTLDKEISENYYIFKGDLALPWSDSIYTTNVEYFDSIDEIFLEIL